MATGRPSKLASFLNRAMPVLSPAEWRISGANSGLYAVEQNSDHGWRLQGIFLNLAEAFAFAERLHGPVSGAAAWCAGVIARCDPNSLGRRPGLSERYRVCTETSWRGRIYQSALADNPFSFANTPGAWPEPLTVEDVARIVASHFVAARRYPDTVEPQAVLALAEHAQGQVQALTALAGTAVFLADLECAPRIRRRHVEDAVAVRDGLGLDAVEPAPRRIPKRAAGNRRGASPYARALLGAGIAGVLLVFASGWTAYRVAEAPESLRLADVGFREPDPATLAQPEPAMAQPIVPLGPVMPTAASPDQRDHSSSRPRPAAAMVAPPPQLADAGRPALYERASRPLAAIVPPPPQPAESGGPALASSQDPGRAEGLVPEASDAQLPLLAESGRSAGVRQPDARGVFQGPVNNETMDQRGKLALVILPTDASGTVRAKFHASEGLLGTGELAGRVTANGHISASGQLMMGKNPFLCNLDGVIQGGRLVGSAQFVRPWGGRVFYSNFNLSRS